MLDKSRILSKLDEMDIYLNELESIMPTSYEEYTSSIEKRRACERLLHILIECTIDICTLIVKGLRLGLPTEEEDVFEKLRRKEIISKQMERKLKAMRGLRNILVHRYGGVDDKLVFENLKKINDFKDFRKEISQLLKK
ncbi:MAG: type VII toxin-antitoxin system HepT family RNase toxin [Candidatus Bathyarchaeales archaeon]